MICGHYQNKPIEKLSRVSPSELETYLITKVIEERDLSSIKSKQSIDIDSALFQLSLNDAHYPIGLSDEYTEFGNFIVTEKWEYPYWRKNELVYVPSEENPIGKYLIILAERESLRKVLTSIHSWPLPPYAEENFVEGNNSAGCVRLKTDDMATLFANVELGALVNIYR